MAGKEVVELDKKITGLALVICSVFPILKVYNVSCGCSPPPQELD